MHQSFNIHGIQRDENTKTCDGADHTAKLLPQVFSHVLALEPCFHVAAGLVSTALVGAAVHASGLPCLGFDAQLLRFLARFGHARCKSLFEPSRQLGMGFSRCRKYRQLVLGLGQDCLDDAMHKQVRIAPDWTGEVRVGVKSQTKVTLIDRGVDRLLHRAQQHGVDLLRIRPVLGGIRNGLKLSWRRIIADRHTNAGDFEVVAQNLLFLGRGPLMHPKQTSVFVLGDEICTADIGREHRLFNQFVCIIAGPRDYFFDVPTFITYDLRLHGLKIDGTAASACFQ